MKHFYGNAKSVFFHFLLSALFFLISILILTALPPQYVLADSSTLLVYDTEGNTLYAFDFDNARAAKATFIVEEAKAVDIVETSEGLTTSVSGNTVTFKIARGAVAPYCIINFTKCLLTLSVDCAADAASLTGTTSGYVGQEIVFDVVPSAEYSRSEISVMAGSILLTRQSDGFHLVLTPNNTMLTILGLIKNEFVNLTFDFDESMAIVSGTTSGYVGDEVVFDITPTGIYSLSKITVSIDGKELTRSSKGYTYTLTKNSKIVVTGLVENPIYEISLDCQNDQATLAGTTKQYYGGDFKFKVVLGKCFDNSKPQILCNGQVLVAINGEYVLTAEKDIVLSVQNIVRNSYSVSYFDGENLIYCDSRKEGLNYSLYTPPTRVGFDFKGWAFSNRIISEIAPNLDTDIELCGVWERQIYTVTANTGSTVQQYYVAYGSLLSIPTPLKNGYVFNGYYTENGTIALRNDGVNLINFLADTTITARYTPISYIMPNDYYDATVKTIKINSDNYKVLSMIKGEETPLKNAADYDILAQVFYGDTLIGFEEFVFSILKAPLSVTAENTEMVLGESINILPVYSGFVGGENAAVLRDLPRLDFPTAAGYFDLCFYGAKADNYAISYVPFELAVLLSSISADCDGKEVVLCCKEGICPYSNFEVKLQESGATVSALKRKLDADELHILSLSLKQGLSQLTLKVEEFDHIMQVAVLNIDGTLSPIATLRENGYLQFKLDYVNSQIVLFVPNSTNVPLILATTLPVGLLLLFVSVFTVLQRHKKMQRHKK